MKIYTKKAKGTDQEFVVCDGTDSSSNFSTDDKEVTLSIIKGKKSNQVFFRINAILTDDVKDIKILEMENPLADLY